MSKDQGAGKRIKRKRPVTRADQLEALLDRSRGRAGKRETLKALFSRLDLAGDGEDLAARLTRAEREYLVLCARRHEARARLVAGAAGIEDRRTDRRSAADRPHFETALQGLQSAAAPVGLSRLLARIAVQACEAMQAESALLALLDAGGESFTYRAAAGARAIACLGRTRPVEETSICGWVIRQGTFLLSNDVITDLRGGNEFRDIVKARAAAAAPLLAGGAVRGALAVADRTDGSSFRRDDVRAILVPFAREASLLLVG